MCKHSYLKTCKFSYLRTCIYLYLAQMYEMYLKNQLQMTTFLLRIMPFNGLAQFLCFRDGGLQIFLYFFYRSSSAISRPNSSSMELWMLAHTLAEKRRPQSISVSHCRGDNVGRSAWRMPWRMRP